MTVSFSINDTVDERSRDLSRLVFTNFCLAKLQDGKVQVGKDQEKAQSEKDSHSKNRGGKKPN